MKRKRRISGARPSAGGLSPFFYQQRHSPTQKVDLPVAWRVRPDGSLSLEYKKVTRRLLDARLWDALAQDQQRAAERIAAGFAILTRGLGVQASALGKPRIDGTPQAPDFPVELLEDYLRWARACQREGIDQAMVMDVLGHGFSCAESDRQRRRRKGTATAELRRALILFCRLRGWPSGRGCGRDSSGRGD